MPDQSYSDTFENLPRGRPYPDSTGLGRRMKAAGLRAYEIAGVCHIAPRTLTEYLAGRMRISPDHMIALCKYFDCEPEDLE